MEEDRVRPTRNKDDPGGLAVALAKGVGGLDDSTRHHRRSRRPPQRPPRQGARVVVDDLSTRFAGQQQRQENRGERLATRLSHDDIPGLYCLG